MDAPDALKLYDILLRVDLAKFIDSCPGEETKDRKPVTMVLLGVRGKQSQLWSLEESDKLMSAQAKRAKLDEIEALRNRVAERVAVRN